MDNGKNGSASGDPARQGGLRAGVDIGGTFTDVVVADSGGGYRIAKVLTTPEDPSLGVLQGLEEALGGGGFGGVQTVVHGTTLATNAIIERKGAPTGLLTTAGFRDVLETGTERRYDQYDLFWEIRSPLVPRRLRIGVPERMRVDGRPHAPLDGDAAREAIRYLLAEGVRSLAVCFLHSFANPAHERAVAELAARVAPEVPVSLSSEVLAELGEYERLSTTVANAYVRPLAERYLAALDEELRGRGFRGSFFIMASNGATLTLDIARRFPVRLVESGPAAGAVAAAGYARSLKRDRVLSLDMGGTTAKIALVRDGEPQRSMELEVGRVSRFTKGSGILLKGPAIELLEIGAGGGSIAHLDEMGLLRVGPQSSGADPGPACYGRGGPAPTVTDANLLLGYADPDYFLGGAMKLARSAAERAVGEGVARPLGLDLIAAARAVYDVVNENMANAISVYTAEQGVDIRDYTLFAFGGAAPAHAAAVAGRLHVRRIVVPPAAGVLSALGCILAPLAFDFSVSAPSTLEGVDLGRVARLYHDMEERARALLATAGAPDGARMVRQAEMRHLGQRYPVTVDLPAWPLQAGDLRLLGEAFRSAYGERYGRHIPEVPAEVMTWRLSAVGLSLGGPAAAMRAGGSPKGGRKGTRPAYFDAPEDPPRATSVFDRYALAPGARVAGPALVEDRESTTVVPPGWGARCDPFGNLLLEVSR